MSRFLIINAGVVWSTCDKYLIAVQFARQVQSNFHTLMQIACSNPTCIKDAFQGATLSAQLNALVIQKLEKKAVRKIAPDELASAGIDFWTLIPKWQFGRNGTLPPFGHYGQLMSFRS